MKRTKWSVSYRNKLATLNMELDSCAAQDAQLSNSDRNYIKSRMREVVEYMDKQLY